MPPPLVLSPAEAAFLDAEAVLSLDLSSARNATKARLVWPGSWSFATNLPKKKKPPAQPSTQAGGACAMLDIGAIGAVSTVVVNVLYSYANFQLRHALLQLLEPADCTATKVPDPSNTDAWALPPQINRTIDRKWDSGTSQVSRLTSRVDIKARAARRKDCPLVVQRLAAGTEQARGLFHRLLFLRRSVTDAPRRGVTRIKSSLLALVF